MMNRVFFLFLVTIVSLVATAYARFLTDEIEQRIREQVDRDDASKVEEGADLFEGDIAMDRTEKDALTSQNDAIKSTRRYWPKARMYFTIHRSISKLARSRIYQAMSHIKRHTCVRFYRRNKRRQHYVEFYQGKRGRCESHIGRQTAHYKQRIYIGRGCERLGTVVHEIMHALGFLHEHSRPDRHHYVRIFWSQIKKGKKGNFKKYSRSISRNLGTPYNYLSVMHYGKNFFAKGKKPTILPKSHNAIIGQRIGLSFYDACQINRLYRCRAQLRCFDRAHPFVCESVKRWCRYSWRVRNNCRRTCRQCCKSWIELVHNSL